MPLLAAATEGIVLMLMASAYMSSTGYSSSSSMIYPGISEAKLMFRLGPFSINQSKLSSTYNPY